MKTSEVIDKFLDKDFNFHANSVSSEEDRLFSYSTIIGQWFNNTLLINITKYSVTTSRHQNYLIIFADRKGIKYYTVSDISRGTCDLSYLYHG